MIALMIGEDMLEPLDFANIPNYRYIGEDYRNTIYDPENAYSVPYTWGITGIIYNTEMVFDDVTSWDILWDEKYMGQILMFSNPRDAFGIAQKRLGYSMNTTDPAELEDCLETLKDQKPLVQAYVMDEIFDKMIGGEAALAPYYAGDALTMIGDNPSLAFAAPEEGVNKFADGMCVPKGSKQKQAAEMYINFMCEPEVAAANADYIGYATPNVAALELLDAEVTEDPVAYPPEEVMEKAEPFGTLPRDARLLMDKLWTDLLSSDENYSRMLVPILLFSALILSVGINVYRVMNKRKKQRFYS
jgi:spermidine/putrescine transport system substrate-binding protein